MDKPYNDIQFDGQFSIDEFRLDNFDTSQPIIDEYLGFFSHKRTPLSVDIWCRYNISQGTNNFATIKTTFKGNLTKTGEQALNIREAASILGEVFNRAIDIFIERADKKGVTLPKRPPTEKQLLDMVSNGFTSMT